MVPTTSTTPMAAMTEPSTIMGATDTGTPLYAPLSGMVRMGERVRMTSSRMGPL
ncbi:Uncharacterised protein [uncultured archaeon]|nr:Uncharacterised protein [uncultured archaeon]